MSLKKGPRGQIYPLKILGKKEKNLIRRDIVYGRNYCAFEGCLNHSPLNTSHAWPSQDRDSAVKFSEVQGN